MVTATASVTGEKVIQTGQMNDIMTQFLWKLSPQEAFKSHNEQQVALKKAMIEADAKRKEQSAAMIRDQLGWDNRAALSTMERSAEMGGSMMTWPEAQTAAMGTAPITRLDDGEAEVAYRPR